MVNGFTTIHDLTTLPVSWVATMQSFTSDYAQNLWFALLGLNRLTRQTQARNVDAYHELCTRLPEIEEIVN